MSQRYRPHPIYYLLTLLLLLLAGLLVWGMRDGVTLGDLLFLGITVVAVGHFAVSFTTSLTLTESGLHVHRPLHLWGKGTTGQSPASPDAPPKPGHPIAFRQLLSVDRTGRLLPVLTILYHPIQVNGLIDVDQIDQLTLPLVTKQDELQEQLEAAVPVHSAPVHSAPIHE